MAAVNVHSDFGAKENKICHCYHFFPLYLAWSYGTGCHDTCFLECWVLSWLFHSPLSPSSRGFLVPLHFLPLEWYSLHIWGCWYFSWKSWFQLMIHPAQYFAGVGCHFLLQGIFLTQGLNPYLLHLQHWQVDSLPLSHLGSLLKDNHHVNISWHLNTAAQSMGPKCSHPSWDQSLNGHTHKRNADWTPCRSLPNISWEFGNWIYTTFLYNWI